MPCDVVVWVKFVPGVACDWCALRMVYQPNCARHRDGARIEEVLVFNAIMSMYNLHALNVVWVVIAAVTD